eukprot:6455798-Amphidinium_carterae.1
MMGKLIMWQLLPASLRGLRGCCRRVALGSERCAFAVAQAHQDTRERERVRDRDRVCAREPSSSQLDHCLVTGLMWLVSHRAAIV